jgi:hypothetical protein
MIVFLQVPQIYTKAYYNFTENSVHIDKVKNKFL